ncbi:MAG: hypothetical protein SVV03_02565 [Candidatus Nanohaloarchaea archaeon]|nr:hypothetical protein [Candidatus Nanohaloarchaea archaeon]
MSEEVETDHTDELSEETITHERIEEIVREETKNELELFRRTQDSERRHSEFHFKQTVELYESKIREIKQRINIETSKNIKPEFHIFRQHKPPYAAYISFGVVVRNE